jgi:hypothetical protein
MINRQFADMLRTPDRSELTDLFFEDQKVSYEAAVTEDIILHQQPFDFDPLSPTPLDPFHLRTYGAEYYRAASMLMEARLSEMTEEHDIPEDVQRMVYHEIEFEHEHRSHKNNASMRKLREAIPRNKKIDREHANDIVAARAGVAGIGKLALLLSRYPEMGGLEVMKYTKPFDLRATQLANAAFIARLRTAEMSDPENLKIADGKIEMTNPQLLNTSVNVGAHVVALKGKEADVTVGGRNLELIGRYSYVALDSAVHLDSVEPLEVPVGDDVINLQPIGITKYFRIPKDDISA